MSNENLFIAAFVYLLSAVISLTLFKRLGLSSVLGYLVAGMLIGPFGLGFIGEEGQDVMHFAEFGVVMMLFLIGLELRPSLLWKLRGPILGLGGGQVLLTTLAIMAVSLITGLSWQMALAIGMTLSLSSTAIVLQSLQEKGQTKESGGQGAFCVLLFQDIAVIPMLALMPLLVTLQPSGGDGHGDGHASSGNAIQAWLSHQPGWVNTMMVLAAVALIILAGRCLFRPILKTVAQTGIREAFVALSLVMVIGIALLMSSLGVSAALGTFLAGVVLADSEYRHELEADIEPFKGLLLAIFFIAVGASIDFALIAGRPVVVAAVVLGLMVLKAGILFGLGTWAKLILDQRLLFSLSLAQGSEFAFVLLGFALTAGVLSVEVSQILIASVALTMALTPLVMLLEEKVLRVRFGTKPADQRKDDELDEDAPVILAGVGRFGNFIARILLARKIPVTVIDSDADHVEFLRKFGIKTFYGDVSRHDLLESAGASRAQLLIVAIDDEERITNLLETAKKHFPNLKILVRALARNHQFDLINAGVEQVVHQHSGSAIHLAELALRELGYRSHLAARIASAFARHDDEAAREIAPLWREEKQHISRMRLRMDELEAQFETEKVLMPEADKAWANEDLRNDTASGNYSDIVPKE